MKLPFLLFTAFLTTAASPVGMWLTEDKGGVIAISSCGNALCGRIAGQLDRPADGSRPTDWQGHPLCGLEIIHRLSETEPGAWTGKITDPRNGNVYDARVTLDEAGNLRLRGYLAITLFGATQVWTPFTGALDADCRITRGPE